MRRADDGLAPKNRLPPLPCSVLDACAGPIGAAELPALREALPCLYPAPGGGGPACAARWTLEPSLVAWCSAVGHPVLGPAWTVEVLHAASCPKSTFGKKGV